MISLIYVSSSKALMPEPELLQLLEQSRDNNARLGITGMLLYKDGNFMQILEGPSQAVTDVYTKIENDPRHSGTIVLLRETIVERNFLGWSMGFRNLGSVASNEVLGYNDFLNESLMAPVFQTNPTRAQKLLLMFRGQR